MKCLSGWRQLWYRVIKGFFHVLMREFEYLNIWIFEYRLLIGSFKYLNTGFWLAHSNSNIWMLNADWPMTNSNIWILATDWSILIQIFEYWLLIGWFQIQIFEYWMLIGWFQVTNNILISNYDKVIRLLWLIALQIPPLMIRSLSRTPIG